MIAVTTQTKDMAFRNAPERKILLHLSDIHFVKNTGGPYDVDSEIRHELERDVGRLREAVGGCNAILVTGDIAYQGQMDEYTRARAWLEGLAALVGLGMEDVWTTPGNHDVDWSVAHQSEALVTFRSELRQERGARLDARLNRFLADPIGPDFYAPLRNYNEFAAPLNCAVTKEKPTWQSDLLLNDGSRLRLIGLNSTLISAKGDDDNSNKLLLGKHQTMFLREAGVEHLTLCHHPPDWLLDGDDVRATLDAKACIQLYGHKHAHSVSRSGDALVIAAGAVQPEREEEGWEPHYNWILVHVASAGDDRTLCVEVRPRVWSDVAHAFVEHSASGDTHFHLAIDPWIIPGAEKQPEQPTTKDASNGLTREAIEEVTEIMRSSRRLRYRFFLLPYGRALAIAEELDLVQDSDRALDSASMLTSILERAKQKYQIQDLERLIDREDARRKAGI